jgi:uncharacterized protein (TIGR00725 family)
MKRKLQIGIMGSAASGKYSDKEVKLAKELGKLIAKSDNFLVFGAEKDQESLSTIAALECKKFAGTTIGITYGKDKKIFDQKSADIIIPCGLERGGGREFVLISSCDVIITIAGGGGTLNEIAVAYQLYIPIISLENSGGWSKKLSNSFLDNRKRLFIKGVKTPVEAITLAIKESKKH